MSRNMFFYSMDIHVVQTRHLRLWLLVIFFILLFVISELSGLRENFSVTYFRQALNENLLSGAAVFIGLFVLGNLAQVPGWIFLAGAVLALGKVNGGSLTFVAAIISCIVTFFLVNQLGQDALRKFDSPMAKRIFQHLDSHPIRSMVLLRMIFQTLPLLNYSLALSRVRFKPYLVATIIGLPLPIFLYCLFFEAVFQNLT